MAKEDKKSEAEKLYVTGGLSCPQIAERLGVNEGTVYRWKAEAEAAGEGSSWESARRVHNLSPREMFSIYAEAVKSWVVDLKKNPDLLADGKIADAIAKHVSVLQKLDTRGQYLGASLDLIEIANKWLAEHQPELKEKMAPHWEGIYQALKEYSSMKGLF
jgi:hypothetical protein